MPALRKRSRAVESPASPPLLGNDDQTQMQTPNISLYELSRVERIKQNRDRMEKLGIFNLSLKLKSQILPRRRSQIDASNIKTPKLSLSVPQSGPVRRSSRLKNATPVSYTEVPLKKNESMENRDVMEPGAKPEVYTEEHEKLLGNTEKNWTLFVDGCGKDGKRIYDPVKGKTCHQCRQKTLGHRTHCSRCNMVQGQFCGDCLYMRYGEHVLEALENPSWICPVCRGICNCSLCRQAKGWAPTGVIYRKISALGYKSVAHYLIQTRRSDINAEKKADAVNPVSAKRSLPFLEEEGGMPNESLEVVENPLGLVNPSSEGNGDQISAKRSLPFSDMQPKSEQIESLETMEPLTAGRLRSRIKRPLNPTSENDGGQVSAEKSLPVSDVKGKSGDVECLEATKPLTASKPNSDSIAGRLRSRLKNP